MEPAAIEELDKARTLGRMSRDPERAAYWKGYARGLSWAHAGEMSGSGGPPDPLPLKAEIGVNTLGACREEQQPRRIK